METLMTLYIIALLYRQTKANATELSACFAGVSHDQFTRLLQMPRCWPTPVAELRAAWRGVGGWLELDDTVLDKFGRHIFGVTWVYSSRLQKVVLGLNLVVLIWTDGQRRIPVGSSSGAKANKAK